MKENYTKGKIAERQMTWRHTEVGNIGIYATSILKCLFNSYDLKRSDKLARGTESASRQSKPQLRRPLPSTGDILKYSKAIIGCTKKAKKI